MSEVILYGTYEEQAELAGMTVANARDLYSDPWNIDVRSIAMANGSEVDEDYVIQDGDKLELVRSEVKHEMTACSS